MGAARSGEETKRSWGIWDSRKKKRNAWPTSSNSLKLRGRKQKGRPEANHVKKGNSEQGGGRKVLKGKTLKEKGGPGPCFKGNTDRRQNAGQSKELGETRSESPGRVKKVKKA